jgi:hypothetical protein
MGVLFRKYKGRFRFALKPYFVMMNARYATMRYDQWLAYVAGIHDRVIVNPVEFLGADLPEANLLRDVVDDVFEEFLREHAFRERSIRRAAFAVGVMSSDKFFS